jgi:hypothetical protein
MAEKSLMNSGGELRSLCVMPSYDVYDSVGGNVGRIEHPAPNVEPGDVLLLEDVAEVVVTRRIDLDGGTADALLEVVVLSRPAHQVA